MGPRTGTGEKAEPFSSGRRIVGLDGALIADEENAVGLRAAHRRAGRRAGPRLIERPDGERRIVSVQAAPLRDSGGSLIGALDLLPRRQRRACARTAPPARASAGCASILNALPAAIYTTDAEGRITFYNEAAVEMSGRRPELGKDKWCVTWKLYTPDGDFASARPMPDGGRAQGESRDPRRRGGGRAARTAAGSRSSPIRRRCTMRPAS